MPKPDDNQVMQAIEKSGRLMKWAQTLMALIIVIAGLGINWGMSKANISSLETQISEMKEARSEEKTLYRAETNKLKSDVLELQLHKAATVEILKNIEADVSDIKKAVNKLARNQ